MEPLGSEKRKEICEKFRDLEKVEKHCPRSLMHNNNFRFVTFVADKYCGTFGTAFKSHIKVYFSTLMFL